MEMNAWGHNSVSEEREEEAGGHENEERGAATFAYLPAIRS